MTYEGDARGQSAPDDAHARRGAPGDDRTWMPFDAEALPAQPAVAPTGPPRASWAPEVRYELPDGLAEGAQRAIDQQLAREVTLHAGARGDAEPIRRAARALARLDHPSVPRVHDVGELDGRAYYTTDRLTGRSPGGDEERPLPTLLRAFLDLGAAVAHAHRAGVVHGALAPARVVLGDAGQAWITGWGEGAPGATPADDVRGLGRVLEALLRARPPAPRALQAVARAAARREGGPYATVEALVEDVRRYLDGRGVVADAESLPRMLARLARRHPGPAAVVGAITLALAGIGVLSGVGLRAAWLDARRARVGAAALGEDAARQAAAAGASAAAAREEAEAARARLVVEDALALAEAEAGRADAPAPVLEAFARAEAQASKVPGDDRDEALRRVRVRRARWALDASRPEDALADLGDTPVAGEDLDTRVLRFLAARRAAGPAAAAAATRSLAALAADEGPVGEVARALEALAPLEEERARRLAALPESFPGNEPVLPDLAARAAPLVERLEAALKRRPELALAHEALGRALALGEDRLRACRELVTCIQLDPADPEPRLRMVQTWHGLMGLHDRRRWVAGWWARQLAYATQLTRRPEPLLELTRLYVQLNDRAGALPFAERLLELPRPADPAARAAWDEAELYAARARMELGRDPGPALAQLRPGPGVEAARLEALLAWAALRSGRTAEGLGHAQAALAALRQLDEEPLRDVIEAIGGAEPPIADEDYPALFQALDRAPLPEVMREHFAKDWVILAQGRSMSRRGVYSHLDLVAGGELLGNYLAAEVELAEARIYLQTPGARMGARAHVFALRSWAQVGLDRDDLRSTARDARALLVGRLRERGQADAAAAFERLDVDAPTTRRAWGLR